jgi:hypothetical protein
MHQTLSDTPLQEPTNPCELAVMILAIASRVGRVLRRLSLRGLAFLTRRSTKRHHRRLTNDAVNYSSDSRINHPHALPHAFPQQE